jgi:lysophospholipase L1-like esterase
VLEVGFRLARVHVGTVQINRRTVRHSANPRLQFELRPNASAHAEVDYHISAQGLRDREIAEEKPAGVRRIAVLGDSIAFGYWVDEKDAFPRQLERLLSSAPGADRVEVLNFGVPGYNLAQETEMLRERALRFAPDLVMVALCLNDLEGADSYEYGLVMDRRARRESWTGRVYERLLDHSVLFAWIEYRRGEMEARREFVRARDPWSGPLYAETAAQLETNLAARFRTIAALLDGAGIPGVVVVFPAFGQKFERYRHHEFHELARRAAMRHGLGVVDLLDCYRGYDFRDVRVDIVHPSPLGHRVAAHGVADALCAQGWRCPGGDRQCGDYKKEEFPLIRGY